MKLHFCNEDITFSLHELTPV